MIYITKDVLNEAMDYAETVAEDTDEAEDIYNDIIATLDILEFNNGDEFLEDLLYGSGSKPIAWIAKEYGLLNRA